ncbi:unnamed protein product [Pleuronectes platessa]|uniref:Uncharacterized protein n=1 Tax=Pleuronectes platessa TaxID=8262 RepID=A0A9N7VSA3_PLEPL|nr:unnamed protein product [Pleuronectes platessa]
MEERMGGGGQVPASNQSEERCAVTRADTGQPQLQLLIMDVQASEDLPLMSTSAASVPSSVQNERRRCQAVTDCPSMIEVGEGAISQPGSLLRAGSRRQQPGRDRVNTNKGEVGEALPKVTWSVSGRGGGGGLEEEMEGGREGGMEGGMEAGGEGTGRSWERVAVETEPSVGWCEVRAVIPGGDCSEMLLVV